MIDSLQRGWMTNDGQEGSEASPEFSSLDRVGKRDATRKHFGIAKILI
jgi:hypothetical protein